MTKEKLVSDLAKSAGITKKQTEAVLDGLANAINGSLKSDGKFALTGVATFSVKDTKPTPARVLGGKAIAAKPAGKRVFIKASSVLKKAVIGA